MLSESSLVWDSLNKDIKDKNLILFNEGRVSYSGSLSLEEGAPVPDGCSRTLLQRQQHFDIETYDRMRVATTEIRRLISENRDIAIRLRPTVTLRNTELERLLRWV